MNVNLLHETVKINKIIFNKNLEKSIEFEYQLPDYYTGIFKVLQFDLEPHISSCRASGKQFILDGNAAIKLIYIDEEGGDIKAIHQNIPFSKTIDLDEDVTDAVLFYNIKTTYKNCKIVSPKKIDVKATLTIAVKIQSQQEENILKSSNDEYIQLKVLPVNVTSKQIWNSQQFNINEQIELNDTVKEVLDVKIRISDDECKIISNKIIAKSIANIEILYCGELKNSLIVEKSSISINNIIDMPNIEENFLYNIRYDVTSTNFEILQEGKVLNITADVIINCYSSLCEKINIVTDAFSTKFEINSKEKEFNSSTIISAINENISIEETLKNINLYKFFNADVKILDLNHIQEKNFINFKGKLNLNILGSTKEGTVETFSKSIPIEFKIKNENVSSSYNNLNINNITILKTEYDFKENKNLEIKVKFNIKGFISTSGNLMTITDIAIDENKIKKKSKAALTLYYPKSGEKIWNIAKQFCTSPTAIIEANNIKGEDIKDETMIIIPII